MEGAEILIYFLRGERMFLLIQATAFVALSSLLQLCLVPLLFLCFRSLIADIVVELDEQSKTPALVLSADRLEVFNPNWTFESVRATICVGRGMCAIPPYLAGWYYEVTLMSTGILQIGM